MPVLLAEVARDDPTLLGLRSRLGAVVAHDGLARLVLDAIPIAVLLSDSSTTMRIRKLSEQSAYPC